MSDVSIATILKMAYGNWLTAHKLKGKNDNAIAFMSKFICMHQLTYTEWLITENLQRNQTKAFPTARLLAKFSEDCDISSITDNGE